MLVSEIKTAVQGRLPQGAMVSNYQIYAWVNGVLAEIKDAYSPIKKTSFTVSANEENDLPEDYVKIAEVQDSSGNRYLDYNVTKDKKIIFEDGGEYTVKYFYLPALVKSLTDTPDVDPAFHSAIVEFCVAKFWEAESEGADMGALNMSRICEERFRFMVNEALKSVKEGVRVTRHVKASPWTVGGRK